MEKIPCIRCNDKMWKYIKPYLKKWGYNIYVTFRTFTVEPIVIINEEGILGNCNNYSDSFIQRYNRYLVTNVEEFLERAAELKGFKYERKDMKTCKIKGIEIKPGMVITGTYKENKEIILVAVPTQKEMAFVDVGNGGWATSYSAIIEEVTSIREPSGGYNIKDGKILWERPKRITLSKNEIANKFGVDVNLIDIVD